jgi:antitoxin VapB
MLAVRMIAPWVRALHADVIGMAALRSSAGPTGSAWRARSAGNSSNPWHILTYMPVSTEQKMQRKAKIFMNNRSQAVRLPKEFQFRTQEVFIRKEGSEVVLSPRPFDWSSYLAEAPVASPSFMDGVEDLPVQERDV